MLESEPRLVDMKIKCLTDVLNDIMILDENGLVYVINGYIDIECYESRLYSRKELNSHVGVGVYDLVKLLDRRKNAKRRHVCLAIILTWFQRKRSGCQMVKIYDFLTSPRTTISGRGLLRRLGSGLIGLEGTKQVMISDDASESMSESGSLSLSEMSDVSDEEETDISELSLHLWERSSNIPRPRFISMY